MSLPEPSDHQWSNIKTAKGWWDEVSAYADYTTKTDDFDLSSGHATAFLGDGQDFFFAGLAGSGKTTCLPYVIQEFGLEFREVAFCAPTGKAAKVMTRKLNEFGIFQKATTIHSLIYQPASEQADAIQARLKDLENHMAYVSSNGSAGRPAINPDFAALVDLKQIRVELHNLSLELSNAMDRSSPQYVMKSINDFPPDVKLIVVDEGSMVGQELAQDLARFGRPIFVMGDPGQLPPVAEEYGFNVTDPDVFLSEIHRQAADSPIIQLAMRVRDGKDLRQGDYGQGVKVVSRREDDVTLDMERDAMILCGTHKKRWTLTKKIRNELGFIETGPCMGEPLLICRNSKVHPALTNGTLVQCATEHGDLLQGIASFPLTVTDPDDGDRKYALEVTQGYFEEHLARRKNAYTATPSAAFTANKKHTHIDFGYVLTCHKSQGSQWDDVVVHDESAAFREDAARWLYTAITRSSDRLTIVQ